MRYKINSPACHIGWWILEGWLLFLPALCLTNMNISMFGNCYRLETISPSKSRRHCSNISAPGELFCPRLTVPEWQFIKMQDDVWRPFLVGRGHNQYWPWPELLQVVGAAWLLLLDACQFQSGAKWKQRIGLDSIISPTPFHRRHHTSVWPYDLAWISRGIDFMLISSSENVELFSVFTCELKHSPLYSLYPRCLSLPFLMIFFRLYKISLRFFLSFFLSKERRHWRKQSWTGNWHEGWELDKISLHRRGFLPHKEGD